MKQRKRDFVVDMVFGTFSSVAFAYVLQQQVDPKGMCPGVQRGRCWTMVSVYAINAVLGAVYIPYVVVRIMRTSGRCSRGSETVKRLSSFATTTATVCWSISVSTTLSQLLGELEYVATSGEVSNSGSGPHIGRDAGPGHTYRRQYGRDDHHYQHQQHENDRHHYSLRRLLEASSDDPGVTIHQMGQVISAKIVTCVVALFIFMLVMFEANRYIKRATRPLAVEMCMLLRSSLHYASAFCVSTIVTCLWFFPIDALSVITDYGMKHVRLVWSLCKVWFFLVTTRAITRRLDWPPEDESQIVLILADSRKCLAALWHKTLSVVLCLGVYDTVDYFISDYLPLNSKKQIYAYYVYAVSVLLFATARRGRLVCGRQTIDTTRGGRSVCCCFPSRRETRNNAVVSVSTRSLQWRRSDEEFYDNAEAWIVSFAFWVPFKSTLIRAYDLSAPISSSGQLDSFEQHLVRLVWQLFLGALIIALCSLLTVGLLGLSRRFACCSNDEKDENANTSTTHDGEEYFVVVDNDSLSNPLIPDAQIVSCDSSTDSGLQQLSSLPRADGEDAYSKKLPSLGDGVPL